jgi:hypothetical protein
MNLRTTLITTALASTMLLGSAAMAFAGASMMSEATLYSAPHGQELDNTIDRGDDVVVRECRSGYCYVHDLDDDDSDGWVKSATIDFTGATGDDDADATDVSPDDNGSLIDLSGLIGMPHRHRR